MTLHRLSEVAPRLARAQAQAQACRACMHESHEAGHCTAVVNAGTGYFGFIPAPCPCVYENRP